MGYESYSFSSTGKRENLPGWSKALTLFWGVVLLAAIALLFFGSISRKVTVNGILASAENIEVKASSAGITSKIFVRDGERVRLGQLLVEISTDQDSADGTVNNKILSYLYDQLAALTTQLAAAKEANKLEILELQHHITAEQTQLKLLRMSIPIQEQKLTLLKETSERGARLAEEGNISNLQYQAFQAAVLDQQQSMHDQQLRIQQLDDALNQDSVHLKQMPQLQAQSQSVLQEQLGLLQENIVKAKAAGVYLLRAKAAGTITFLQVKLGQQLSAGQQIMTIASRDHQLYAQAYLPSSAIAFVKNGQEVRLMYDAFPFQKFGTGQGRISSISSTILKPNEIGEAVQVSQPVYSVRVTLSKLTIPAFGVDVPLRSGMSFKADIRLARQSLWELILDPLLSARQRV